MNSRPLCPVTDDPTDVDALTPGHFLIGRPLLSLPEESTLDLKSNPSQRWKLTVKLRDDFWKIWQRQYLHTLQHRGKWYRREENIKEGSLVLIKSENNGPGQWPLARVIKLHPGSDELVRVVTVRTATSQLQRPISKLILLPIEPYV